MHPDDSSSSFSSSSTTSEPRSPARKKQRGNWRSAPTPPPVDYDGAYFQSYSHMGVHEEIIKDSVLINTYKNAIMHHQANIEGKVVLDVGCGTGLLAMFCAQAGARKVYAVEASDIAEKVRDVLEVNHLSHIIEVFHGRVEDAEIPEEVDVIVSEWMGNMLLCENMLSSIITAKERWLKTGGVILPSRATLYMAPFTNPKRHLEVVELWQDDFYGIDMSAFIPLTKKSTSQGAYIERIKPKNLLTCHHVVKHINIHTITIPELASITLDFEMKTLKPGMLNGFAFWFDADFSGPPNPKDYPAPVLSTGPHNPQTHWEQTLIYFSDPIKVEQFQTIKGSLKLSQCQRNNRFIDVHLELRLNDISLTKEFTLG